MYKEYRTKGGSPESWAEVFLPGATTLPTFTEAALRGNRYWREIRARLAPGASVIDAGSGLGAWVRFLNAAGYRARGVDYSPEMHARLAREAPEVDWILGDIRAIPVPDASIDAVISWGVIEHDEAGPDAALREFHRVVKPGGWIFVSVPIDTYEHRYASMVQTDDPGPAGAFFQYLFKPREIADVVARAGFDIDLAEPCGRHPALLAPRLCLSLQSAPRIVHKIGFGVLSRVASLTPRADNMVLVVGRRR
ncbi:MAG: class I SAM-dependent methyltransferase [Polyangiales bacterium]